MPTSPVAIDIGKFLLMFLCFITPPLLYFRSKFYLLLSNNYTRHYLFGEASRIVNFLLTKFDINYSIISAHILRLVHYYMSF